MNDITICGQTNFRNKVVRFGIKPDDRRRHLYVIGKTGTGKSSLLENMAIDDIRAGNGLAVIDPHGEFAERVLDFVPENRIDDVIYFNPADIDHPIAFNVLEHVDIEHRHLVASGIMGVFKKIWPDVWSARMEYILNNALLALLEYPGTTLLGIMRMLAEKDYRKKIVSALRDPVIKAFWTNEFDRYSQRLEVEAVAAIQNKVGQFVSNPIIRNIIGQTHSTIDMRKVMDEGKIFIGNISKGRVGEDNSALLGAMMITKLQLAAMSRVSIPMSERRDFYLYVDEFQNFSTESFASILSEARKYRLNLILAHQYIEQLDELVKPAVFGNVGTIICFRIGAEDAEFLEKEFMPEFNANDLVNLANRSIYIKLMIDGVTTAPFSASTCDLYEKPKNAVRDVIIENSRLRYSVPRTKVEQKITEEWMADAQMIQEKISQRGEMPLRRVLRQEGNRSGQFQDNRFRREPAREPMRPEVRRETVGYEPSRPESARQESPNPVTSLGGRYGGRIEPPKKEEKRKEVNIDDLRKAIEESLKNIG